MQKPWRLQEAKTRFSEVVEAASQGEPQHVTRRGREAVVVLSEKSYRDLKSIARSGTPGFVAHLLAVPNDFQASRGKVALRDIDL